MNTNIKGHFLIRNTTDGRTMIIGTMRELILPEGTEEELHYLDMEVMQRVRFNPGNLFKGLRADQVLTLRGADTNKMPIIKG